MVVTSSAQVPPLTLYCINSLTNRCQMFAERFIVYTQTVEDVNGTVMGRVFKFAMEIPGLNFISIVMHSMATDRFYPPSKFV